MRMTHEMFVVMWLVHLLFLGVAGLCIMGNINVQDQELALQGECHGQENLVMKKLSLLSHLASLMDLNGSRYKKEKFDTWVLTFVDLY